MIMFSSDRLGESLLVQFFNGGFSFSCTVGPWGWAGSLYIARKRIWWRPIDYAAAEIAGPYRRRESNVLARYAAMRAWLRALFLAVYRGEQINFMGSAS